VNVVTAGGVTHALLTIPFVFEISVVTTVGLELPEGEVTVKVAGADVCPPLETVTEAAPVEAIRLELTDAVT
jgi:hypothetical protein